MTEIQFLSKFVFSNLPRVNPLPQQINKGYLTKKINRTWTTAQDKCLGVKLLVMSCYQGCLKNTVELAFIPMFLKWMLMESSIVRELF